MTPFNQRLVAQRDFMNPSILEKVIDQYDIDEIGSNYPKDLYDPHGMDPSDFFEEIAKRQ